MMIKAGFILQANSFILPREGFLGDIRPVGFLGENTTLKHKNLFTETESGCSLFYKSNPLRVRVKSRSKQYPVLHAPLIISKSKYGHPHKARSGY